MFYQEFLKWIKDQNFKEISFKNNKLIFSNSENYNKPESDYELFLDTCICNTEGKNIVELEIEIPNKKKVIKRIKCKLRIDVS